MDEQVSGLLEMLPSEEPGVRRELVFRLALVLELNAMAPASRESNRADYAQSLPDDLLDVGLSREEKLEILHEPRRAFLPAPEASEILWAMGKSGLREAADLLLAVIVECDSALSEEAFFQAVSAIERYTFQRECEISVDLERGLPKLVESSRRFESERIGEVMSYLEKNLERVTGRTLLQWAGSQSSGSAISGGRHSLTRRPGGSPGSTWKI